MNDCQNVEIREALPEFVHGTLPEVERIRVEEHVSECFDCAAELAIIRAVRDGALAATVPVDVARISAAIPAYSRTSGRRGMRRIYMELAAACLIGAVGISALVIHNGASPAGVAAVNSADPGLMLVNTSQLSDAGLVQLTQDLDDLQALPTVDPESVTPVVLQEVAEPDIVGDSE